MPSLSRAKLLSAFQEASRGVTEFVYRGVEVAAGGDQSGAAVPLPADVEALWGGPEVQKKPGPEKKYSEEDLRIREQQAWAKGAQEASAHDRERLEKELAAERGKVAAALSRFGKEREEYFRNVEAEVVRLVLAVARKVLHREAQVDPLLLTGVVRVALEKIAGGMAVKLRVPAEQAEAWRAAVKLAAENGPAVEVIGDDSLNGPECLIVTEAGSTDISLEGQLAEIERGFLDLLSLRPGNNSEELRAPSYAA
jgi:flagellar assembly protein FliH